MTCFTSSSNLANDISTATFPISERALSSKVNETVGFSNIRKSVWESTCATVLFGVSLLYFDQVAGTIRRCATRDPVSGHHHILPNVAASVAADYFHHTLVIGGKTFILQRSFRMVERFQTLPSPFATILSDRNPADAPELGARV